MGNANLSSVATAKQPYGGFIARFLANWKARRKGVAARGCSVNDALGDRARNTDTPLTPDALPPPRGERGALTREIERYAYVRWILRLFAASLILSGASVTILFIAGAMVRSRPSYTLVAPASLEAEAEALFSGQPEANLDDLILYLNTALPLMHKVDDRGSPDLLLLRSLVAPAIYEEARAELSRAARTAKQNFIVQNLVITRIEDVDVKKDRGRVGAYVKGYLAIIIQSRNKHVIMPYRAEVVMDLTPPSRLNRFPFVIVRREVRTDKAATAWDVARSTASAKTDGTK